MIKNYLKVAWRNIRKGKIHSFINIAGLALGVTVFLFIMQYVAFEWNANRFNKNFYELYRINVLDKEGSSSYSVAPGFAPIVKSKFPGIINYTRVANNIGAGVISSDDSNTADKVLRVDEIAYVDGSFLSMFSFPLLSGTPSLSATKTMAISETISQRLFGATNAIGKTVTVNNQFGKTLYTVNAVYRLPKESDIKAEVLLSLETLASAANRDENDWADPNGTDNSFTSIYIQLRKDAKAPVLANNITTFVRSINPGSKTDVIYLQPFSELHLAPSFNYPHQTYGNLLLVTVFTCIAILILLIAWLNYINLSTAQALNRSKEVGIRKVLGAKRNQLIFQHLAETFLLTLISVLIALLLVNLLQPLFNSFTGQALSLAVLNNGLFWLAGIAMILLGSLLSGSYVAFVLTAFKPSNAIRNNGEVLIKGLFVRKALVVFQFTVSIIFIISTAVLYNQLDYMKNENLGMNLKQLLVIQGPTVSSEGQAQKNVAFKNSLAQLPFVKKQAASNNLPGIGYNFTQNGIGRLNATEGEKKKSFSMFISDQNFFDVYGISFLQGNPFTVNDAERSWNNVRKVIINEKAAQQLGFNLKDNIVGQKINWNEEYEIAGVVKDYHHLSLRDPIQPTIYLASVSFSFFTIQIDTKNIQAKVVTLKDIYTKTFPGNPFEYFFADEKYNQQYHAEQQLGKVFITAAFVALFIACLGLFGLATFSARQRVKEIGIRKVLGASVANITSLISKDFIKLVIIAIIIASPVAWWAMSTWLENFAYRTNIGVWIFILSGVIAVTIALATISFQAIKAAIANPVKSLRSE